MISANGGLPVHRYTPQVTQRWPRGSEPAYPYPIVHGLPRFGGYDSCLVVTCGLSRFTRVFPCNKKITGEQTVKMLGEQWFEPYGAPKQMHSDEDVRIRSDTGWYEQVQTPSTWR